MLKRLTLAALVLVVYVVGGELGLAAPFTSGNVSPVWPPSGIAVAAILVLGRGVCPAIAAGAFLVNFFTPLPHAAALGIAIGNTVGPLTGAWLLTRFSGFQPSLARLRDVLRLIVFAGLGGSAISATLGTLVLSLAHVAAWSNTASAWLVWWLGDAMGVLIVAPLALTLPGLRPTLVARRLLEAVALLGASLAACMLVFGINPGPGHDVLALVLFPFVMWGATRFETAGAAVISFAIGAIAVWKTAQGFGPFVHGTPLQNAALMQSFLAIIALSGLSVAALITERTALVREATEREAETRGEAGRKKARDTILLLSRAVEQTAESIVVTDKQGVIQYVNPAFETTTGYCWDEAIGRTPAILKSGQHDRRFYQHLWDEILNGRSFRGTLVNRKKSGETYWAEQTITPVRNDAGTITHFVSALQDVTELRRKQEQEVQLRLAHQVQQQFYRPSIPVAGFDLAGASYPANETGGDYFDFIPTPAAGLYLAIGDASGHGFPSALVMALTRAYVRSLAAMELDVGEILTRVNLMLLADLEDNRFVTLLLARVDARGRQISYASAGHVPGILLGANGCVHSMLAATGPPLGLFETSEFVTCDVPLEQRSVVLLVTDGVTESMNQDDEQFGGQRLVDYACQQSGGSARLLADGICDAARRFAFPAPQTDDITSVVVKVER